MFNENTCMTTGRSMISDKFISNLILDINDKTITDFFLYGKYEKYIYDHVDKIGKKYDLCYNKKIIEFNGGFWHSNPKIYGPDEIHRVKKIKSSDIWREDKIKIEAAQKYGYDVLVIWESEYINDRDSIISKSKKFLGI